MAGLCALSVNPAVYKGNFAEDLFWATFYQQHLGEEYCGLAVQKDDKVKVQTRAGLFRPNFSNSFKDLKGGEGIGYCGATKQPIFAYSKLGQLTVCFSGNIINCSELVHELKSRGSIFEREDEVEIIIHLIAQGNNIIDGLKNVGQKVRGAYTILVLNEGGIYAVRGQNGHWPLVIGEKTGAVVVASESGGFSNLGFKLVRDFKPGEIIFIENGKVKIKGMIPSEKIQICSFIWVYTAFANGVFEGIPASLVRKRLGAALARRDIETGFIPDIVAPVPDSGRFHAIGYFQEFCREIAEGKIDHVPFYDELLLKYPYAGRSYTPQIQRTRDQEAHIKILGSGEDYTGKKVVICDDSIVRGTQTQTNLVPKLRSLGISEIHFRISNPELLSHCPWGKTTKKGEVLAARLPKKEDRLKFLGVQSLEYNTIDDLVRAIGLPRERLCVDCDLPH